MKYYVYLHVTEDTGEIFYVGNIVSRLDKSGYIAIFQITQTERTMAYMNQDRKKKLTENVKAALAGTGLKFTTKVRNHSTIVLTFKSGPVDFLKEIVSDRWARENPTYDGGVSINPYWFREHFTGQAKLILEKTIVALNDGNHDRSDIMTDYFDVGWYVDVNIGTWEKPYVVTT